MVSMNVREEMEAKKGLVRGTGREACMVKVSRKGTGERIGKRALHEWSVDDDKEQDVDDLGRVVECGGSETDGFSGGRRG